MEPHDFLPLQVIWDLPDNWCEEAHLTGILQAAGSMLKGLGLADRFVFIVTADSDRVAVKHSDRVVVLQTSDEGHEIPDYVADVFMTFKNYQPFDPVPGNLRVIPLGCNKDVPKLAPKPMVARALDVFFAGRPEYRDSFFSNATLALEDHEDLNVEISKAPGFRLGLSPQDYADRLADTKIALSPRGVSHETFRTYEAMRAGCVVIAESQLSSWFNEGWPVIEVADWQGVGSLTRELLSDPRQLEEISQQSLDWWQEKCSEDAVAHYMVRELSLKLLGASG